jgi:hypothetical protein
MGRILPVASLLAQLNKPPRQERTPGGEAFTVRDSYFLPTF